MPIKFNLSLIAIVISFYGCIPENDFALPVTLPSNTEVLANSNIKATINAYD